jgi:transposase
MLLPPDLRDWVPADHLGHFVIDAIRELDVRMARVNEQGSGSEPYPPVMMLGLLIYSDATEVFGSRRIEPTTDENVAVRLRCGDTHPDHDTICSFRRQLARAEIEARAFARAQQESARKAPDQPGSQSRIMPAGGKTRFEQSDNAQAAVEVESGLIVGLRVGQVGEGGSDR